MSVDQVIEKAEFFRSEGADVIDIGCLPNKHFPHLEEIVQELKNRNFMSALTHIILMNLYEVLKQVLTIYLALNPKHIIY